MKTTKTNYLRTLLHSMLMATCMACLLSCSDDAEQKETPTPSPEGKPGDKREIMLTLKNKLKLVTKADANQPGTTKAGATKDADAAPVTKADKDLIATDAENEIASMDIYVFGSDEENGIYSFQEMLYYRGDGSSIDQKWATPFELLKKSDNETNALLQLQKGLYVKLYIVANQPGIAGSIDGVADVAELTYDKFSALVMTGTGDKGRVVSTVGTPTENNFKKFRTPLLNPNNADDVLRTPLTMVGSYLTPIDLTDFAVNTRLQIGFKLTRLSARFDVVNDAAASKLTIQSISMANGRSGSGLFPIKPYRAEAPLKDDLITYPARKFEGAQTAADKLVKGAFYSYPSPLEDKACLVVSGVYAVNQTEKKEVTYQIPFKQITDGTGNYIEIAYNHRYTLYITDADEYHLDVNIQVADWDEAGSIDDYQPDTAPDDLEITIDKTNGEYYPTINTISLMLDKQNFCTISTASNSGVTMTYTYDGGDTQHNWLIVEEIKKEETETKSAFPAPKAEVLPGTTKYTYKCYPDPEYKQNIFPRARVLFKDNATGQEQFVYIRPYGKPEIHAIAKSAGDLNPNSYVDTTFVLTLHRALQSTLPLRVVCPDGSEVGKKPDWLNVEKNQAQSSSTEYYYTLTVTDTLTNADNTDYTLEFVNANEKTLVTPITIKMVNAGIDRGWVAGDLNTLNADSTELTMPLVHDNSFNIVFMSVEGVKVDLDFGEGNPHWLTHNGPVFTKAGTVRNSIKFYLDNNHLVGAKPVNVTMTNDYKGEQFKFKVIPAPQIPILPDAATTLSPTNNSYTKSSKQIAIYKHSSATSSVKLQVLTPGGCQVVNALSWLTVIKDSTDYRTCNFIFAIAPGATAPIDGKPYTVKLQNMTDPTKEVELTIVPKFDVPTVKLNSVSHANFNSYSETSGSKSVNLYDAPSGSSWVKLNISALGGSKFTNVPNWITISPVSVTNATSGTYTLTLNKSVLKSGQILNSATIRLENANNKNTYTEIKVQRISSTIDATYQNIANTSGNATAVNMTTYNGNASFRLNLNSANGFKASANWNGGTANWLTFDTKTFAKGNQTLTFTMNASYLSGAKETTITLTNQLSGGPNYTFKVKPVFKAPTVARSAGTPAGNSLNGTTITLYKLNSGTSTIQLKVSAVGGSKLSYSGGNNVKFSATSVTTVDGYYTLTANAASGGGTLTVMNNSDNSQKATYTIVLKSGEVTANNLSVTAANSGNTIIPVTAELGVTAAVLNNNWNGGNQWFDITTASTIPSSSAQNIVITQRNNVNTIMKPTTIRLTSKNGGGYRDIVVTPTLAAPTLSSTSGSDADFYLNTAKTFTFNTTSAGGGANATTSNSNVATVTRTNNTYTVTPKGLGTCTISVPNASNTNLKSTYTVTVSGKNYQGKAVWKYYGYYIAPEDAGSSKWTTTLTKDYCSNKSGATWYVPSADEWRKILGGTSGTGDAPDTVYKDYKNKGVFASTYYWSTTEYNSSYAYLMNFHGSSAYVSNSYIKSGSRQVRCVAR